MKLFVAISDDSALWPHFAEYYRKMGVKEFYVATAPSTPNLPKIASSVAVHTFPLVPENNCHMGAHPVTHELRKQFVAPDEWHWIADLDEFHEIDRPLDLLLTEATMMGCNSVGGRFIDRLTEDGTLPQVGKEDVFQQFPLQADLSKLTGTNCRKIQLLRGHLRPVPCYHKVEGERPFPKEMKVHHFKWNGSLLPRLHRRVFQLKTNGFQHYGESERIIQHLRFYGRIDVEAVKRIM
jgi:hypothetical protein